MRRSLFDGHVRELAPEVTKTAVGRLMQAAQDLENRRPGAVNRSELDDVSPGEGRTDKRILETICDFRPAYSLHTYDYMTDFASRHKYDHGICHMQRLPADSVPLVLRRACFPTSE